jgi:transposase-like protein
MPKPMTDSVADGQVMPDPALEKRTRRTFSAGYKLRVVQEADACEHGELGALLRREKLYHNQIQQWRRELAEGGVDALAKSAPGPKAKQSPEQRKIADLEKRIRQLAYQLQLKDDCLELQKKALSMLDHRQSEDGA